MVTIIAFSRSIYHYVFRLRDTRRILSKGEDFMINDDFLDLPSPIAVSGNNGSDLKKDCIKAAGVLRRWKNLLFMIMVLCLLLLQTSFWLVRTGQIGIPEGTNTEPSVVSEGETATRISTAPNDSAGVGSAESANGPRSLSLLTFDITFELLTSIVRLTNVILVFISALYGLTMYFGLGVSLKVGLGGLGHICKAFYLSLIIFVLLLPWQIFFDSIALGAIYTPQELVSRCTADISDTFGMVLFYLRFSGYWALVMLLLIMAQLRSARWTKSILIIPGKA